MKWLFFVLLFLIGLPISARAETFFLTDLSRQTIKLYFEGSNLDKSSIRTLLKEKMPKEYGRAAGVFVTLSSAGQTRACWGSLYPTHSTIAESTVYTTIDALRKDYRYRPIGHGEWKDLKPQVTVIEKIEPIVSIKSQNPLRDGLVLKSGSKSAVLLPGEVSDAYYQLIKCKLKAGVHKGEPYQLYKIKAKIYE
jgi:AMMECR1 domain-containing protein